MDETRLQDRFPSPKEEQSPIFEKGYPFFKTSYGGLLYPLKGCLFDAELLKEGIASQWFFRRPQGQTFEHYPGQSCKNDADTNMQQPGQISVPLIFRIEGIAIGLPTELAPAQRDRLLGGKLMVVIQGNRIVSDIPLALIPAYPPEDPTVRKIDDRGCFPMLYRGQGVLAPTESLEVCVRWSDPLQLDRFIKMKVFLCGTNYTPV